LDGSFFSKPNPCGKSSHVLLSPSTVADLGRPTADARIGSGKPSPCPARRPKGSSPSYAASKNASVHPWPWCTNHPGEPVEMKTLQRQVQTFVAHVRTGPNYAATPALQGMIEQIEHYGPKLFADPLTVSTPQGPRTIQPQRTNNVMERLFRDLKHSLGRSLRTMLPDTPLVKNLQNPEYLKILLDGQPSLAALFAQIDPANVREELVKAQHSPEYVPRALQRFIANLPNPNPIKNFIKITLPNRLSLP
jgi:hypothetical protein